MKSLSRRAVLRNLGVLSAGATLGSPALLMGQQTSVANPYPKDICVFLVGPWLVMSNDPEMPGSILAMTCDDPMHMYVHGVYKGTPVTSPLSPKKYTMTAAYSASHTPKPHVAGSLFSVHKQNLFCIEDSAHALTLSPAVAGLRKVALPIPDEILPAVLVPKSCGAQTPLFTWSDAPKSQFMPNTVATTLILRYANAASLSIDGAVVAKQGDHYHIEMRFTKRITNHAAERQHVISFSKKTSKMLLYNANALNITFDPGPEHALQMGVEGFDATELGFKTPPTPAGKPAISHLDPEVCMRNFEDADCTGAIMSVNNG